MNCKQGDLAIIIKSYAGNEGKIVTCIRFIPSLEFIEGIFDSWEIDRYLKSANGNITNFIPDSFLRSIRDSDKEDEMISLVKIKEKV